VHFPPQPRERAPVPHGGKTQHVGELGAKHESTVNDICRGVLFSRETRCMYR